MAMRRQRSVAAIFAASALSSLTQTAATAAAAAVGTQMTQPPQGTLPGGGTNSVIRSNNETSAAARLQLKARAFAFYTFQS